MLERRKRKRKTAPKYQASTGNTGTTGFATVDDKLLEKIKSLNDAHLLENLKKEQLLLKDKKRDSKGKPDEILVLNHKIDSLSSWITSMAQSFQQQLANQANYNYEEAEEEPVDQPSFIESAPTTPTSIEKPTKPKPKKKGADQKLNK
ncbi:MAG TPA: hypothetical protein VIJ14_02040, partial [Rhabdochlamydiaceae bacterium]